MSTATPDVPAPEAPAPEAPAPEAPAPDALATGEREICRHFARFGKCRYGDRCRFEHVAREVSPGDQVSKDAGGLLGGDELAD